MDGLLPMTDENDDEEEEPTFRDMVEQSMENTDLEELYEEYDGL